MVELWYWSACVFINCGKTLLFTIRDSNPEGNYIRSKSSISLSFWEEVVGTLILIYSRIYKLRAKFRARRWNNYHGQPRPGNLDRPYITVLRGLQLIVRLAVSDKDYTRGRARTSTLDARFSARAISKLPRNAPGFTTRRSAALSAAPM